MNYKMFKELYDGDEQNDGIKIAEALVSRQLRSTLSANEIVHLLAMAQKLKATKTIEEYCKAVGHTYESFADCYDLSENQLRKWEREGLDEYTKQMLTFVCLSAELEFMRHHTCQLCGGDYYTSDEESLYCTKCYTDLCMTMLREARL